MLQALNLKKYFGGVAAVDGATLLAAKGKITALIGPNGAGKTTFFNLLSGTLLPDAGELLLAGETITRLPSEERARRGLSRTFQLSRQFKNLTVGDHLHLAREQDDDKFWKSLWVRRQTSGEAELRAILSKVGLELALKTYAAELSYGQAKLLGLAMALLHPHKILLLDEPVAGVNPVIREKIAELLRALRSEGETVLLIEHDIRFVMPLADNVVVMDRGRAIAAGSPAEIQRDPAVLGAYLGEQL
ncbi:ABC transporter ATP-binding protein [Patescibacteria group bacterium]|nr:MAG: ABC transporter ATP-binding protein [Patescibacteria group bacterium]